MDVHAALGRFSYTASSGSKGINSVGRFIPLLPLRPLTNPPANLPIVNMLYRILAVLALAVVYVTAERHIVTFDNR